MRVEISYARVTKLRILKLGLRFSQIISFGLSEGALITGCGLLMYWNFWHSLCQEKTNSDPVAVIKCERKAWMHFLLWFCFYFCFCFHKKKIETKTSFLKLSIWQFFRKKKDVLASVLLLRPTKISWRRYVIGEIWVKSANSQQLSIKADRRAQCKLQAIGKWETKVSLLENPLPSHTDNMKQSARVNQLSHTIL